MKKNMIYKWHISIIGLLRTLSQILFFMFLPALYVSVFEGIKQLYIGLIHGNFDLQALRLYLISIIAVIPVTIVAGRFFCGWMCAFGAVGDWIYALSKKVIKRRFQVGEKADRLLKKVKHIWLILLIILVWTTGVNIFKSENPWDAFGMLLTPGKLPDIGYVTLSLTPAFIILVLIVVSSFFIERFFCRYLCPLGAIFAVISKLKTFKINKPGKSCGKCRRCTENCPMGIPLYSAGISKSGECIECLRCVSICPRDNVSLKVSAVKSDLQPVVSGAAVVSIMTGIYFAGTLTTDHMSAFPVPQTLPSSSTPANPMANETSAAAGARAASKYKDGVYQGKGIGYRGGETIVSVMITDGRISDVTVVSDQDTPQFFSYAAPTVIQSIIDSQSANVNAVSGATYTSNGIMQAVNQALYYASKG